MKPIAYATVLFAGVCLFATESKAQCSGGSCSMGIRPVRRVVNVVSQVRPVQRVRNGLRNKPVRRVLGRVFRGR